MSCSSVAGMSGVESSGLTFDEWEASCISGTPQLPRVGVLPEDKVPSLINKMILANRVKVVGQGYGYFVTVLVNLIFNLSEFQVKMLLFLVSLI